MSDAVTILSTQLQGQLASPSAWLIGTTYTAGQSVSYLGANYYALVGSTGVTPGTDPTTWGLLTGSGPQATTIASLSSAIVAGAAGVVATRTTNRVTLLQAALNQVSVPPTTSVGELASSFNEVRAAAAFLAGASNLDSQLSVLRSRDSSGSPLTAVIRNIPGGTYSTWASALVTSAAAYETLAAEAALTA
jgi:hypothetical protein